MARVHRVHHVRRVHKVHFVTARAIVVQDPATLNDKIITEDEKTITTEDGDKIRTEED
jgi:hypothetical protein